MSRKDLDKNFRVKSDNSDGLKYYTIPFDPFDLYGVFYEESTKRFVRMPSDIADKVSANVGILNSNTAGGRVRFSTDSKRISVSVKYEVLGFAPHLSVLGGKIISYGTKKVLYGYNFKHANFVKVDINGKRHSVNSAFAKFGYKTKFITKQKNSRLPIYNVSKTDGGLFFNVENLNTTTKTAFRYPLGAPIMFGCEAEIKNGYSVYGFARSEHRECRVFIKQKSGVVSCREIAPVSANFRRKIGLYGLKNAEVCFFGEEYCRENVTVSLEEGDMDPVYDSGWEKITDEYMGVGYRKKNVCGNVFFLLPMNK